MTVVAPATEQSGVGHSITFLKPLMANQVYDGDEFRGWAVEGSPADCVKLAVSKLFVDEAGDIVRPDLVVSGINGGLNVGVNVLYSGTVAAATEAALHDLPSIAVSPGVGRPRPLQHRRGDGDARDRADARARRLARPPAVHLNVPTDATRSDAEPEVRVTGMTTRRFGGVVRRARRPEGAPLLLDHRSADGRPPADDSDVAAIPRRSAVAHPAGDRSDKDRTTPSDEVVAGRSRPGFVDLAPSRRRRRDDSETPNVARHARHRGARAGVRRGR